MQKGIDAYSREGMRAPKRPQSHVTLELRAFFCRLEGTPGNHGNDSSCVPVAVGVSVVCRAPARGELFLVHKVPAFGELFFVRLPALDERSHSVYTGNRILSHNSGVRHAEEVDYCSDQGQYEIRGM